MSLVHNAAVTFLEDLIEEAEAGRVVFQGLKASDYHVTLEWRAERPPAAPAAPPSTSPPIVTDQATGRPLCPKCERPAEDIPEENGGPAVFCAACDQSW